MLNRRSDVVKKFVNPLDEYSYHEYLRQNK